MCVGRGGLLFSGRDADTAVVSLVILNGANQIHLWQVCMKCIHLASLVQVSVAVKLVMVVNLQMINFSEGSHTTMHEFFSYQGADDSVVNVSI
jgi:hypothetical protein